MHEDCNFYYINTSTYSHTLPTKCNFIYKLYKEVVLHVSVSVGDLQSDRTAGELTQAYIFVYLTLFQLDARINAFVLQSI